MRKILTPRSIGKSVSRSRRKINFVGHAGKSDKWYKQKSHRKKRVAVRKSIAKDLDDPFVSEKLFGDEWSSSKDGKYMSDDVKTLRK